MTLVLVLAAGLVLGYLAVERVRVDRHRDAIPLRVAVTGTRGKSTVTRLLAAVLREDGRPVIARTTGSEAMLILPDGEEQPVRRRGRPSIMEQKRFVELGARHGVDVAVAEVMSIHAENHRVETERLIRPHVVLITNVRVDHTAAVGYTRESAADVLALDIPAGARVFIPAAECLPAFRERAARVGATLVEVAPDDAGSPADPGLDWPENLQLVRAAATWLGVADQAIGAGIRSARHDIGALRVWRYRPPGSPAGCLLVNAFAANDPDSTMRVLDRVLDAIGSADATTATGDAAGARPRRCRGLLSLRADREDRSAQWLDALDAGLIDRFSSLHVCGRHATALRWRLRGHRPAAEVHVVRETRPGPILDAVLRGSGAGDLVFGFGNIGGLGAELVAHWTRHAEPVEL